ncbi:hypothetical protein LAB1_39650 [Roseibium sp. LAB1]
MKIGEATMTAACALAITSFGLFAPRLADVCTRVVYLGASEQVITARSMDWKTDVGTNLWLFPRGMKRNGEEGASSLEWTSKHGSVIASGYDISTTDGMNEAGLVANVLWLVESDYQRPHQLKEPAARIEILHSNEQAGLAYGASSGSQFRTSTSD